MDALRECVAVLQELPNWYPGGTKELRVRLCPRVVAVRAPRADGIACLSVITAADHCSPWSQTGRAPSRWSRSSAGTSRYSAWRAAGQRVGRRHNADVVSATRVHHCRPRKVVDDMAATAQAPPPPDQGSLPAEAWVQRAAGGTHARGYLPRDDTALN